MDDVCSAVQFAMDQLGSEGVEGQAKGSHLQLC